MALRCRTAATSATAAALPYAGAAAGLPHGGRPLLDRAASSATNSPQAAGTYKPWRLSASVVVLAPKYTSTGISDKFDYRICYVKRAAKSSFMPGSMVFPGGAVDAQDRDLASQFAVTPGQASEPEPLDAAIRYAAVREVFEESGIGIFEPPIEWRQQDELSSWRQRVHKHGAPELLNLCRSVGVVPAANALCYWCSFVTPDFEHARLRKGGFVTRFFVWPVPPEAGDVMEFAASDNQETSELVWLAPDEALDAVQTGVITMVPPQWYITKELADCCPRIIDIAAYAASPSRQLQRDYPIKPYPATMMPEEHEAMLRRYGERGSNDELSEAPRVFALCYPGDEQHQVFPGPPGARHRMLMAGTFGSRMTYELQRLPTPSLPLTETPSAAGWLRVARL